MHKILIPTALGLAIAAAVTVPAVATAAPESPASSVSAKTGSASRAALPIGTQVDGPRDFADGLVRYSGATASDEFGEYVDMSWTFDLTPEQLEAHTWSYLAPHSNWPLDLNDEGNRGHVFHANMASGWDDSFDLTILRDGVPFTTVSIPVPVIPNKWS